MIQTLTLHIEIEYETHGESPKTLAQTLESAADHLANNGLLSGATNATVETWNAWVSITPTKNN